MINPQPIQDRPALVQVAVIVIMAAVVIAADVVFLAGEPDPFPFIRTFAAKLLSFGKSFCFRRISEVILCSS